MFKFEDVNVLSFKISVKDLSVLTITSKATRNLVEGFCTVRPLLKKRVIQRLHTPAAGPPLPVEKQSRLVQTFSKLGILKFIADFHFLCLKMF